ncbi:MAG: PKD domain-containing protein [Thermoplasmata archaeon]
MNRTTFQGLRPTVAIALALLVAIPSAPLVLPTAGTAASITIRTSASPVPSSARVEVAPAIQPPPGTMVLGPVPAAQPIGVAVGLPSQNAAGLSAWDAAEEIPGTSEFHHPLPAAQASARFGASARNVRSAELYFEKFGLTTTVSPDGLLVYVNGPSAAVARAFGTSFEEYRLPGGRTIYGHPTPAVLPSMVPWSGAIGLGNATPIVPAGIGRPIEAAAPRPFAGCPTGPGGGLLPCAIETAYNTSTLLTAGTNGTGERIAVLDAYSGDETQPQLEKDLRTFSNVTAVPVGTVHYLYPVPSSVSLNTSSTNPGWGLEEALDLQWTRAMAPGAVIDMTFSPNSGPGLYAAIDRLVGNDSVNAISLSWGEPDVGVFNAYSGACTAGCNASTDGSYAILGPVLELAAAEGIGVFAASGDCGSADGTSHVSTNYPASDPYVTGVGGTVLTLAGGLYSSETAWGGNESGKTAPGCNNGGGSGGGYAPIPEPWWQAGLPAGHTTRGVPDVSMVGGTAVYVAYHGGASAVEGTSVGTPIWAGIDALADQYAHADLGLLDPALYRVLLGSRYVDDFHDIKSGSNGYHARAGWDPVTGIGTPIVANLVTDLARGGDLPGNDLATFVAAAPYHGVAPLTVRFTVTVSGGSGSYPIEGVSFGDSNASLTLTGQTSYTYQTPGDYFVQSFVVDSGGNESVSAPLAVVVGGGGPLTVSLRATTDAPAVGAPVRFTTVATGGTLPYSYNVWYGDGSSALGISTANTTHAFEVAGVFCAIAIVTDQASPSDIGTSPEVAISVGGATGTACANASTPLTVTPELLPAERDAPAEFPNLFTVSGGPSGNGVNPPTITLTSGDLYTTACECTILRASGNYSIEETALASNGATANATDAVIVGAPLVGTFTSSALAGPIPWTVDFTAATAGGLGASAALTHWTFASLGTSVGATASWTFTTAGEYLVTGAVGDQGYGNASESFVVYAEPTAGAVPPGVTATISPSQAIDSGATVQFRGSVIDPIGPTTLFWRLGGGYSAAGAAANETYFAPLAGGTNTLAIQMLLYGPGFALEQSALTVSLPSFFAVEAGGFVPAVDDLSLTANVTPTFGSAPLPIQGNAAVGGVAGGYIVWEFGDGTSFGGSLAPGPSSVAHTFVSASNFTIAVEASNPFDDQAVASEAVAVSRPLAAVGNLSVQSGDAPLAVAFTGRAVGGVGGAYTFRWTFGDGGVAYTPNAQETYRTPGVYQVGLEVGDDRFQTAGANWSVTVTAPALFAETVLIGGAAVGILLAVILGGIVRRRRRSAPPSP